MKKIKMLLGSLVLIGCLSITTPAVAQSADSGTTTAQTTTDDHDDNGKWGLAGLLGLLGLLGLRKPAHVNDRVEHRTTNTVR